MNNQYIKCTTIIVSLLFILPTFAIAKKVYSPYVDEGEWEIEMQNDIIRSQNPRDSGSSKHQVELSYGINSFWHTGMYLVFERMTNGEKKYTQTKWQNLLQWTEKGEYWLDVGAYIEYIWPTETSQAQVFEFKLLLEKQVSLWSNTLNLILKQPMTNGAATAFSYAWRSQYQRDDTFKPGFEVYGALGSSNQMDMFQQPSWVGPILRFEIPHDVELEVGWLIRPQEGPAYGDFKLNIEYEF